MTEGKTATTVESTEPPVGQMVAVSAATMALLLSQRWLIPLLDADSVRTWSTIFLAIVVQSVPFLIGGVLLSAAITTLISERALKRLVPRNPVLGVPVAGIAGVGLPGCECAAVPVTSGLIRRGVAPAVALTFLLAAPAVNPAVLVSTAVAFPGRPEMVIARFAASLLTAILVGWWCVWRGLRLRLRTPVEAPHHRGGLLGFLVAVRHDFLYAAGFLVLGAMIAAAVNTFVPRQVVDSVAGHAILAVVTLAVFAFVVALCSEADAFVAASLTAFSDTAKLVFLVVGPAMDVKLASMEAGQFGASFARQFVPVVLVTATLTACGVGWWLL